ncbi:MAG: hypothetical protein IAB80_03700 [Bacteroidetes bacterium]|uniref:VWA-like domain-containing protein n=1 Tax=Candidatus Cryptobacteroides excrementipullorum TaxID=2840761 RepID=A0A9D9NLK2_9BACT|nr:hypothetical protein [Candidatus Cryptobacteroides excrementipullorum]
MKTREEEKLIVLAEERLRHLAEQWFLSEPAFFAVYCTHRVVMNPNISCAVRTGKGRIEYNPEIIDILSDNALEEAVGIEMIRLFLKHPYERRPEHCTGSRMLAASDMAIWSNYRFSYCVITSPDSAGLPEGQSYEWYLAHLPLSGHEDPDSDSDASDSAGQGESLKGTETTETSASEISEESAEDKTALWEEDSVMSEMINDIVRNIKDWGSLAGSMAEQIVASSRSRIDYRKILNSFRASIISTKRCLTRMRPSRRYGFQQMGSKFDFTTGLLIAVDTSGSISSGMLEYFFGVINRFFKYGIKTIDVIQFDWELHGDAVTLEKAVAKMDISGRGGTSFQPAIDYAAKHGKEYDGMIFLTDGYAPEPVLPKYFPLKIAWVCEDRQSYEQHHKWMRKYGRVCYMDLK